jgi:NlpC/P60 family putative phage cell wall peptidase
MIDRAAIVAEARTWIGTRWQHQASLKGVACDCIGLVAGVARSLGLKAADEFDTTPNLRSYGRQPDPALLLAGCDRLLERVTLSETDRGDVLVMKFQKEPQHFAIVSELDPPYMVHALAHSRRVVEHRVDALWLSRIVRVYRFRGVA